MDKQSHTPGPWNWHGPCMGGIYKVSTLDSNDAVLMRVYVAGQNADANARLIAAAPDLLAERDRLLAENAALREVLDSLQACASSVVDAHGETIKNSLRIDLWASINNGRAALARVRGAE